MAEATEATIPPETLMPGARRLVETARAKAGGAAPGINHWLLALVERHGPMAEGMAQGLNARMLADNLRAKVAGAQGGDPLAEDAVAAQALARAQERGKLQAGERDVAAIILAAAGYTVVDEAASVSVPAPSVALATEPAAGATWQPRARRPTPALDRFGRDVTRAAQEGKVGPLVGREDVIQIAVETLCRRTKRNPVLVGPAGVGKTAIIEGLAQRIVQGRVPDLLRGARIVSLSRSALLAGVQTSGDVNERLQAILSEAGQEGILLFIDELHAFMAFADDFKPALARGDIACLGATTDDEYRRFIEEDRALERRFQPLRVQPLSPEETLAVLNALRETLATARGVDIADDTLSHLVDLAERFLPNRQFPDKAVDLLEQCVAHALAEGKTEVSRAEADDVVQRLVGMPLSFEERLGALAAGLEENGLLAPAAAAALAGRLRVTLGGLDIRPARPNAAVLLVDSAAPDAEPLARLLAEALYGGEDRVVVLNFGRMTQDYDVSMLLGSPPGYVGYSQSLPIHQVAQMPWCVVVCAGIDACAPSIRAVLTQALASGQITDASGKRIYLSDTIVLLTASVRPPSRRVMGFRNDDGEAPGAEGPDWREAASEELGEDITDECDLVCAVADDAGGGGRRQARLLSDLRERYRRAGLDLRWDDGLTTWLSAHGAGHHTSRDWERLIDERLSPLLVTYLPQGNPQEPLPLRIQAAGDTLRVVAPTGEESE